MAFAGVMNGEFSHTLITKWNIHPRLWIIDIYADDVNDFKASFFNPKAPPGFEAYTLAEAGKLEAYANVLSRDLRWRAKMLFRSDEPSSYRSDRTGNWYLDKWPNRLRTDMPKIGPAKTDCPASPQETEAVRNFAARLKGPFVLTETPSKFLLLSARSADCVRAQRAALCAGSAQNFSTTERRRSSRWTKFPALHPRPSGLAGADPDISPRHGAVGPDQPLGAHFDFCEFCSCISAYTP